MFKINLNPNVHMDRRTPIPVATKATPKTADDIVSDILACTSSGRQFICHPDLVSEVLRHFPCVQNGKRYVVTRMVGHKGAVKLMIDPIREISSAARARLAEIRGCQEGRLLAFHREPQVRAGDGAPTTIDH